MHVRTDAAAFAVMASMIVSIYANAFERTAMI